MPSLCKRKVSSAKAQLYYNVIIRHYLTCSRQQHIKSFDELTGALVLTHKRLDPQHVPCRSYSLQDKVLNATSTEHIARNKSKQQPRPISTENI